MAGELYPVPAWRAGLLCRCPRCGTAPLFDGVLTVKARCGACGLDLTPHDTGDGPAVFVILILGAVAVGMAFALEVLAQPPLWVHAVVWPPVILGLAVAMLRPIKALLVALHYRNLRHEYDGG